MIQLGERMYASHAKHFLKILYEQPLSFLKTMVYTLLPCCANRYSSPLFRMPTAEHIKQQLRFHNTGPEQTPGVIIMQLHSR